MYPLCIFDLDGTLVDTLADLTQSLNGALARYGYSTLTPWQVSAIIGHGLEYTAKAALPEGEKDKWRLIHREFTAYYGEHCCDASQPYEGMLKTLTQLKNGGVTLAVASNKAHRYTMKLLNTLFPRDCFSMILGQMDKFERKPAPDALEFILDYFGVSKDQALYVGDSDTDVEFARNAGVDCVSVSWGYRTRRVLLSAGATCILDDPGELPDIVLR